MKRCFNILPLFAPPLTYELSYFLKTQHRIYQEIMRSKILNPNTKMPVLPSTLKKIWASLMVLNGSESFMRYTTNPASLMWWAVRFGGL